MFWSRHFELASFNIVSAVWYVDRLHDIYLTLVKNRDLRVIQGYYFHFPFLRRQKFISVSAYLKWISIRFYPATPPLKLNVNTNFLLRVNCWDFFMGGAGCLRLRSAKERGYSRLLLQEVYMSCFVKPILPAI